MTFGTAIETGLKKYVDFSGRASRSEYWFFTLFAALVSFGALVMDAAIGDGDGGAFYFLAVVGMFLPSTAVGVRRLHDTERSGFWYLIALVPIVGVILLIVWFCTPGTDGSNEYGDDSLVQSVATAGFTRRGNMRTDDLDRLDRLSAMLSRGVITQEDYDAQKAVILSSR